MLVLNQLRGLGTRSAAIKNSKGLYKFLLRKCELLPTEDTIKFYKHTVRQGFIQHRDESEPERIQEIIQQAVSDSDWVLKKYKVENTEIRLKKKTESSE